MSLKTKNGAAKRLVLEARLAGHNTYKTFQDHCFTLKLSSFIQILLVLRPSVYLFRGLFFRISPKRIFPRECLRLEIITGQTIKSKWITTKMSELNHVRFTHQPMAGPMKRTQMKRWNVHRKDPKSTNHSTWLTEGSKSVGSLTSGQVSWDLRVLGSSF